MPKPIKILITVEEGAFGYIFNRLESMPGVVAFEPIGTDYTAKRAVADKPDKPHKPGERLPPGTIETLVLEELKRGASESGPLADALERSGIVRARLPAVLHRLIHKKLVSRSGKRGEFVYKLRGNNHNG